MELEVYESLYRLEDDHWWFRGRRDVVAALLERGGVSPAAAGGGAPRILDAGCGTGRNLVELSRYGAAVGVDASQVAIDYCRERGLTDVVRAPLEQLPFDDGEFALTVSTDVIEHIDDDAAVLRELLRVTAPGGLLLVTTPAYMWLWSHQDETHHHRRRYTRGELSRAARTAGWEPELVTHFNAMLLPPIALVRKVGRRFISSGREDTDLTPAPLNSLLRLPLRAEAALISAGLRLPFGVSIAMTCRRPRGGG